MNHGGCKPTNIAGRSGLAQALFNQPHVRIQRQDLVDMLALYVKMVDLTRFNQYF
jgi:hypothetical protein